MDGYCGVLRTFIVMLLHASVMLERLSVLGIKKRFSVHGNSWRCSKKDSLNVTAVQFHYIVLCIYKVYEY